MNKEVSKSNKLFKEFMVIVEICKKSKNPFGKLVCFGTHLNTKSQLDETDFYQYRWCKGLGEKVDKWIRGMREFPTERRISYQLIIEFCKEVIKR